MNQKIYKSILAVLLILTITNCTVYKKRYSKGFTVSKNRSWNNSKVEEQKSTDIIIQPTKDIENDLSTNDEPCHQSESHSEIKECDDIVSINNAVITEIPEEKKAIINEIKEDKLLKDRGKRIKIGKYLKKYSIKLHSESNEKFNYFGLIGGLIFIAAVIFFIIFSPSLIQAIILGEFVIIFIFLTILLLSYVFTVISFKKMIKSDFTIKHKWISIFFFSGISLYFLYAFTVSFLIGLIILLFSGDIIGLILVLAAILFLALIVFGIIRIVKSF